MDQYGIIALLKATVAATPEETKDVEDGIADFLRRSGTNAKNYKPRKMQLVFE
jgi:hypothetical protein